MLIQIYNRHFSLPSLGGRITLHKEKSCGFFVVVVYVIYALEKEWLLWILSLRLTRFWVWAGYLISMSSLHIHEIEVYILPSSQFWLRFNEWIHEKLLVWYLTYRRHFINVGHSYLRINDLVWIHSKNHLIYLLFWVFYLYHWWNRIFIVLTIIYNRTDSVV